jgi:hypothetical chaperone protein
VSPAPVEGWCAIDFGTSNSGLAVPDGRGGVRLVAIGEGSPTMPTAVFYSTDDDEAGTLPDVVRPAGALPRAYGHAALRAYVSGASGRLMRSLKSILGSDLVDQSTDLGAGHSVRYDEVVTGYLRHLRGIGETAIGRPISKAVLGRPVYFVDDDPARDALAAATLERAARAAGFDDVAFEFEPIAAALDHEQRAIDDELVLVADIGGGTSDFSLVRVGPERRGRDDRRPDILGSHGVHVAGTDFDRRVALVSVLPPLGLGARGPVNRGAREVPSAIYHDLATWHRINLCYRPTRVAELRAMSDWYAQPAQHRRLMRVLDDRLGHALAARSENAKIAAAAGDRVDVDLSDVEAGLAATLEPGQAIAAVEDELARIVAGARETVRRAGVEVSAIDTLYFTGGSTGLAVLTQRLAAAFPQARPVQGDRLASVARGLGVRGARRYGAQGG